MLQSCGMQLTDEPEKRCYPLGDRLYCRSCNIRQQDKLGYSTTLPKEVWFSKLYVYHKNTFIDFD